MMPRRQHLFITLFSGLIKWTMEEIVEKSDVSKEILRNDIELVSTNLFLNGATF